MNSELTQAQLALIARRKAGFEEFYRDMLSINATFAEALNAPNPKLIVADPRPYLPYVEDFVRAFEASSEEFNWFVMCVGNYVGEYLVNELGGCWLVNEHPGSPYVGRYVVGRFHAVSNPLASVDPFEVAKALHASESPRSLKILLAEVLSELEQA